MVSSKTLTPLVTSSHQLLAMAHAMEKEAARRYHELAVAMTARGEQSLAALFETMSSIEEKHASYIAKDADQTSDQLISFFQDGWEVPENFDDEAGSSHRLTPYLALAIAVRNEERAFTFYTYISSNAPDERIRRMAEGLAMEELEHAALLRKERRKAFYAERETKRPPAAIPASIEEFWDAAGQIEWYAAQYHRALVDTFADDSPDTNLFLMAAEDEEACARKAANFSGMTLADGFPEYSATREGGLRLLEEAFERYSDIAEHAQNEDVMQASLITADHALRRLSVVLGTRHPSDMRANIE